MAIDALQLSISHWLFLPGSKGIGLSVCIIFHVLNLKNLMSCPSISEYGQKACSGGAPPLELSIENTKASSCLVIMEPSASKLKVW
jgi:hypothetical protein